MLCWRTYSPGLSYGPYCYCCQAMLAIDFKLSPCHFTLYPASIKRAFFSLVVPQGNSICHVWNSLLLRFQSSLHSKALCQFQGFQLRVGTTPVEVAKKLVWRAIRIRVETAPVLCCFWRFQSLGKILWKMLRNFLIDGIVSGWMVTLDSNQWIN